MNCNEAVAALVGSLESGAPMSEEQREHIRSCERCRTLLDSAKDFQALLDGNGIEPPPVNETLHAAEDEVRRAATRKNAVRWGAVLIVALIAGLVLVRMDPPFLAAAGIDASLAGLVAIAVVIAVLPVVAIVWFVHRARAANPLYKRLRPGRQISGVCLGLSERFDVNVSIIRLLFVVALFADGLGFWLYLILDLAMPIHPDDRQHLLRFRIQRWWEARRAGF